MNNQKIKLAIPQSKQFLFRSFCVFSLLSSQLTWSVPRYRSLLSRCSPKRTDPPTKSSFLKLWMYYLLKSILANNFLFISFSLFIYLFAHFSLYECESVERTFIQLFLFICVMAIWNGWFSYGVAGWNKSIINKW